jgi:putative ABC transport system substrate-binding protein
VSTQNWESPTDQLEVHVDPGAKPADLLSSSRGRSTSWSNLRAARALGITVPPSLAAQVTGVGAVTRPAKYAFSDADDAASTPAHATSTGGTAWLIEREPAARYTDGAVTHQSRRALLRDLGQLGATLAGFVLLGGCGSVSDQLRPPPKIVRIGVLADRSLAPAQWDAFLGGLQERGWVDGQNLALEWRFTEDDNAWSGLAAELLRAPVDILVCNSNITVLAAKQASTTIPIVMTGVADPVATGLVASLSQPGANVTGTSVDNAPTGPKRLQLLKEVAPGLSRVAVIFNLANAAAVLNLEELRVGARALGVQLLELDLRAVDDMESVFQKAENWPADALYVGNSVAPVWRQRLAELARLNHLPMISTNSTDVRAGGLIAYGPSFPPLYRRAATYVDKILRGARPVDLPVEQPTAFDLAINLKTAHDLGVAIPPSVAQQVTQWVQ